MYDIAIGAPREAVWTALTHVLRQAFGGGGAVVARVLGSDSLHSTPGFDGRPGRRCRDSTWSTPTQAAG